MPLKLGFVTTRKRKRRQWHRRARSAAKQSAEGEFRFRSEVKQIVVKQIVELAVVVGGVSSFRSDDFTALALVAARKGKVAIRNSRNCGHVTLISVLSANPNCNGFSRHACRANWIKGAFSRSLSFLSHVSVASACSRRGLVF